LDTHPQIPLSCVRKDHAPAQVVLSPARGSGSGRGLTAAVGRPRWRARHD
jgi:hypothetical protein